MASLNLDINYFTHPKTKRLIRLLGRGSEVLPLKLWVFTARYFADDGRLTGTSAQEIEDECQWWGTPGKMIAAMISEKFLELDGETYVVHQWTEHEGHISAFNERAKKGAKARWDKVRGEKGDANSDATSIASSNAPTSPTNQPTNLPTAARDAPNGLSEEVDRYIGGHRMLMWTKPLADELKRLVTAAGWEETRRLIDEAVARGTTKPISYATTVFNGMQASERLKELKNGKRRAVVSAPRSNDYAPPPKKLEGVK